MDLIPLGRPARAGLNLLFLSFLFVSPAQGGEARKSAGAPSAGNDCAPRIPWAGDLQKLSQSGNALNQLEFTKEFKNLRVRDKIYYEDFSSNCKLEFKPMSDRTPALVKGVSWKLVWAGSNFYPGNPKTDVEVATCPPGPASAPDFCVSVQCSIPKDDSRSRRWFLSDDICNKARLMPTMAVARLTSGSLELFVTYTGRDSTGLSSCLRDLGAKIGDFNPCTGKK